MIRGPLSQPLSRRVSGFCGIALVGGGSASRKLTNASLGAQRGPSALFYIGSHFPNVEEVRHREHDGIEFSNCSRERRPPRIADTVQIADVRSPTWGLPCSTMRLNPGQNQDAKRGIAAAAQRTSGGCCGVIPIPSSPRSMPGSQPHNLKRTKEGPLVSNSPP